MREIDGQIEKVGCWSSGGILVLIWNVNTMVSNQKIFWKKEEKKKSSYPGQRRPLTVVAGRPEVRCGPLWVVVAAVAAPLPAAELLLLLLGRGRAPRGRGGCRGCWGSLSCPAAPRCWPPGQPPLAEPSCTRPEARWCVLRVILTSKCHWPFCSWLCESESHRPCRLSPRARKWRSQSRDASWFVGPLTWRLHQPCLQERGH